MGQMADGAQLERAFAGATVHDLFNLLSVAVLFPLEVISHYLYYLTKAMLPSSVADGESWSGPIKKIVSPLAGRVLKANKNVIKDIATKKVESCDDYYPVACIDGIEDYKHCTTKCEDGDIPGETCGRVGTITCDKKTGCKFDTLLSLLVVFIVKHIVLIQYRLFYYSSSSFKALHSSRTEPPKRTMTSLEESAWSCLSLC
jgi:hypothetical protein